MFAVKVNSLLTSISYLPNCSVTLLTVVIVISTAKMKMEPTWEWVIERVGHPTTTYNLNRLLEAKQSNRPGNAQANSFK